MKLDASPDTIRAVAEALKLAAILDDRVAHADAARIAAWSEKVETHNLEREDLIAGLQNFYDSPMQHPIGIGDLIHYGRSARRDRTEREDEEIREIRRETQDAKADADEAHAIAAGFVGGPVKARTPRLRSAEAALQSCQGKRESQDAIREFFDAKRAAGKR